ncbi:MAG: glycosyltransferase family 4 protein [Thermoanaerobaculales bacterium]
MVTSHKAKRSELPVTAVAGQQLETSQTSRPVVSLVAHDPTVPSFRLRLAPLRPVLESCGFDVRVVTLGRGREWLRVARLTREWRCSSLLVFQQVKLLAGERSFVSRLCPAWVLDVDDAIMFARPRRVGAAPRQGAWRQLRFRRMAARCRVVIAGSQSLANTIGKAASRLLVLPTPVDLAAYPLAAPAARERLLLAWIGLGSNLRYLEALAPVLQRLQADGVAVELRVICDRLPVMPGVPCVLVPWSVAGEGAALAECDLGVAPLDDDAWTRGKSAYRCIQYAAAGLPTVASPVGANREVVHEGETGLLADTSEKWYAAIARLCRDPLLRRQMGATARARATEFDLPRYAQRYAALVQALLGVSAPNAD